jgi:hypothetical protein
MGGSKAGFSTARDGFAYAHHRVTLEVTEMAKDWP